MRGLMKSGQSCRSDRSHSMRGVGETQQGLFGFFRVSFLGNEDSPSFQVWGGTSHMRAYDLL